MSSGASSDVLAVNERRIKQRPASVAAAVFLFAMAVYSVATVDYNSRRFPSATLGVTGRLAKGERGMRIDHVDAAGAAERAGLRVGDHILAINGQTLTTIYPFWDGVHSGTASIAVSPERWSG